jgi:hypothetical protein
MKTTEPSRTIFLRKNRPEPKLIIHLYLVLSLRMNGIIPAQGIDLRILSSGAK